ncbi:hypothetical protein HMPREF9714_00625 [Myroides odoratimimus CCUG 12901]|uniref:HTH araC/xylS-type domain-containing protein n=1 Tax=Myroides odoratimimus CCUG 10230 TaxID=883150 RepID=A0ABN0EDG7_9FLAO|nr:MULTISPECIES: AraC family transcriptional regulator [Myroides]AJA68850.1 Helix-turn-helix domain/AraC-like ligand binding domain [Myroides sp. A21]EHO11542.1 hypothetical protein HMPREF9712_00654 [Myroides odoratimimus CCUG 10230]EHO14088.1 hypothetical protein HMPREF9714_00625 [Myroides odoratimimus CCUG 12901]EPH09696.1 hypothetical protein HMPREF9713_02710 [Myroides odoratimimus CCUG 12700]MCO7722488.1 AraC family transcriptional regulator [Myroides odoratimimus]
MKKIERYSFNSIIKNHTDLTASGVFITNGEEDIKDYFAFIPHSIDACVIGLVTGGEAQVSINLREYHLKKGMLIVLPPNAIVVPISFTEDLKMKSIMFTFDFVAPLALIHDFSIDLQLYKSPVITLNEANYSVVKRLYKLISQCYYDTVNFTPHDVLEHLLYALIIQISQLMKTLKSKAKSSSRAECITEDFFVLLYKHYKREKAVSFYADRLSISTAYLTTTIRKQTGHSILHWISEAVVLYAKSLLKSSRMSINEISEELGFKETTLFCRYFKRYTDMTPNQYRGLKV